MDLSMRFSQCDGWRWVTYSGSRRRIPGVKIFISQVFKDNELNHSQIHQNIAHSMTEKHSRSVFDTFRVGPSERVFRCSGREQGLFRKTYGHAENALITLAGHGDGCKE